MIISVSHYSHLDHCVGKFRIEKDIKTIEAYDHIMPRKSIETAVGFIIVPRLGHKDNIWWDIRPPPMASKGEKKPNFVFSEKELFREVKRLSIKIANMRPRSKPS